MVPAGQVYRNRARGVIHYNRRIIRDRARLDALLATVRGFVREVAIPNEDRVEDVPLEVSMCKYYATEVCGRATGRVVQIFAGQGYVKGTGIERFYRDVRAFRIYEGTSQIHQLNIAKLLLKGGS
jgi:acyl-CoA dehydrogenase